MKLSSAHISEIYCRSLGIHKVHSEDSDQIGSSWSGFAGCTGHFVSFVALRLILKFRISPRSQGHRINLKIVHFQDSVKTLWKYILYKRFHLPNITGVFIVPGWLFFTNLSKIRGINILPRIYYRKCIFSQDSDPGSIQTLLVKILHRAKMCLTNCMLTNLWLRLWRFRQIDVLILIVFLLSFFTELVPFLFSRSGIKATSYCITKIKLLPYLLGNVTQE